MNKEKRTIISAIMTVITIWLFIVTIVTGRENVKQKVELEEAKQELAEYKADELEIYPCPFCGSEDVCVVDMFNNRTDYYVRCENCHSSGPTTTPNTDNWNLSKDEAIELWNAAYKKGNKE